MAGNKHRQPVPPELLTREQEALLDLYIQKLDTIFEELKQAEKIQVEIETEHLKRILTT